MELTISEYRVGQENQGVSAVFEAPFTVSGNSAALLSLGRRLVRACSEIDLLAYSVVMVEGTEAEIEATRVLQQNREDERILALATGIMKRRAAKSR
jgi:hypothetical protein